MALIITVESHNTKRHVIVFICIVMVCIGISFQRQISSIEKYFQLNISSVSNVSKTLTLSSSKRKTVISQSSCYCNSRQNKIDECDFMLNRSVLIHHPPFDARLQSTPCLLLDKWFLTEEQNQPPIIFSVILVVWNQEANIENILIGLLNYTHEIWELIIVFDQCRDKSISIVNQILSNSLNPTLVHIRLIEQETGVSETSADNIGMRASHSTSMYFILIQDDQIMRVPGWNVLLAEPARIYSDVFSISARCGHTAWSRTRHHFIGRCGRNIDKPLVMSRRKRCKFYVRDTGNRGPLLLQASRTRQLGYLDEEHYWLGDDDHDINFRAYAAHRWVAGFRPLDFDAPLAIGGGRRKTSVMQTKEENEYQQSRTQKQNKKLSALDQFKAKQWRDKDIHVILDFSIGSVNLRTFMQLLNNSKELTRKHNQIRPLCRPISLADKLKGYMFW